jgi:hypothetical protein
MAIHCKFRNSTATAVVVGSFGMSSNASYRAALNAGDVAGEDLMEGRRAFIVWDESTGDIVFEGKYRVDVQNNGGMNRFEILTAGGKVMIAPGWSSKDNTF